MSLEGSVGTRLEVMPDFLQGDQPFSVVFCSDGCAQAHPSGVAPEASEEWFNSSEVLILFVMPRSALLFPHAAWPQPGCMVRLRVSSCFVDVVDNLAVAWCESRLRASARSERTRTVSTFIVRPFVAFLQGGRGESAMLPSEGTEHGVSGA
jgi:hypothetical protein